MARASLAGATEAAQGLPQLLGPARDAYTSGLNITAVIAAVVFLGLAGLAAVMLREVPAFGPGPTQAEGGEASPAPDSLAPTAHETSCTRA